ncbi:MAG: hypothetical protein WC955_10150 [Elusimicrobiota bacterium]
MRSILKLVAGTMLLMAACCIVSTPHLIAASWGDSFNITFTPVSSDTVPPAGVTGLFTETTSKNGEVKVTWTSPGEDGTVGAILRGQWVLKYTDSLLDNFDTAPYSKSAEFSAAEGTVSSTTISGLVVGTTYYFWIKISDERLNWSELSNKRSFVVYDMWPTAFSLRLPLDNGTASLVKPVFTWQSSYAGSDDGSFRDEITYSLTYSTAVGFGSYTQIDTTDTTFTVLKDLDNVTTYYWKVMAYDCYSASVTSTQTGWKFFVLGINFKYSDLNNDGVLEYVGNGDSSNVGGYDIYRDPSGICKSLIQLDADNDNKIDHFVDITSDGIPDKYYDPDNDIVTIIKQIDVDGDGDKELVFDTNNDGKLDKFISASYYNIIFEYIKIQEPKLYPGVPNPFNPMNGNSMAIVFDLTESGNVVMEIYNIAGEKIGVLINGYRMAGRHRINWNGGNGEFDGTDGQIVGSNKKVGSGVYIIMLTIDKQVKTTRVAVKKR